MAITTSTAQHSKPQHSMNSSSSSLISKPSMPFAVWPLDAGRWLLARHEPWRGWGRWLCGTVILAGFVLVPAGFAIAILGNFFTTMGNTQGGPSRSPDPSAVNEAPNLVMIAIIYLMGQVMLLLMLLIGFMLFMVWCFLATTLWDVLHLPFAKDYRPKEWLFRTTVLADRGGIGLERRWGTLRHLTWYQRSRVADIRAIEHHVVVDLDFPSETRCLASGLEPQKAQQLAAQLCRRLELPPQPPTH